MSGRGEGTDVTDVTRVPDVQQSEAHVAGVGARMTVKKGTSPADDGVARETIIDVRDVSVYYGSFRAVRDISVPIARQEITALIGPSGCGKTTFLRCLNRMNDLIEGARVEGTILYHGIDLYDDDVDPVE